MSGPRLTLIGDGIENPGNARAMLDAAAMFGAACLFRDPAGLLNCSDTTETGTPFPLLSSDALAAFSPLIVLDNVPGASSVYGFRPPAGPQPALTAGNERRGVSATLRAQAAAAIEIPLVSRRLNTLNVAAASAVALYYLSRSGGGRQNIRAHPSSRRPDVLLSAPADHVELGSAIRSAGAFGWQRLLIDDRNRVWFGVERATLAEGRAAARRHRNPIRLIPTDPALRTGYQYVTVVSPRRDGTPLQRANLSRGPRQLIVIQDESGLDATSEDWQRLGHRVEFVTLGLPPPLAAYRYRLTAAIVLAEVARQVGRRAPDVRAPRRPLPPLYDRDLALIAAERGETVFVDELQIY